MIESPGKTIARRDNYDAKYQPGMLGPGPSGYNAEKPKKYNSKFTMSSKLPNLEDKYKNEGKPGPGNYNPVVRDKNQSPKLVFGKSVRTSIGDINSSEKRPGPGDYISSMEPLL